MEEGPSLNLLFNLFVLLSVLINILLVMKEVKILSLKEKDIPEEGKEDILDFDNKKTS